VRRALILAACLALAVSGPASAKVPAAQFKSELLSLQGSTIEGSVGANGATTDLTLKIEKPDAKSMEALALIKTVLLPMWPVLLAIRPGN